MDKTNVFLNRHELISACQPLNLNPIIYPSIGSTSDELRKLALAGAREGTIVIAQNQTNGHGRLGRSFLSPNGGLYFSLLLRPRTSINNTLTLTAAAAVAVAQTLEQLGSAECKIKWVNDILINQRKVCGILTQSATLGNQKQPSFVILGVGINLLTDTADFSPEVSKIASNVFGQTAPPNIFCRTLTEFLTRFWGFYGSLPQVPFYEEYCKRCVSIGHTVTVLKNGIPCGKATTLSIEPDFSLAVEFEDGRKDCLNSGEISIQTQN